MSGGIYIDIIIVILAISSVFRGWQIGWLRQFFSTIGFFGGLFLGAFLQRFFVNLTHTTLPRTILTLIITLGIAFAFLSVGEYVGYRLKARLNIKSLNTADNFLGSGISIVTLLFSVWLFASILGSLAIPGFRNAVDNSKIISYMDKHLPSAPSVISGIGSLIDPNGFPRVFVGGEPAPSNNYPLPSLDQMQPAVTRDRASVVKIEGVGCGGVVEGSGFIAGGNIVATNAHVIAGINHPYVYDSNGSHSASVIWFDPNLDFAVLRVYGLNGTPLTINASISANGTDGAVLGYPGGGPFSVSLSAILDEFSATGRNIYNQGNTDRSVYEIHASVMPGNSGGPLIEQNGDVDGVVFAESTTYQNIGYALTANQIVPAINEAQSQNLVRSTGGCAQ